MLYELLVPPPPPPAYLMSVAAEPTRLRLIQSPTLLGSVSPGQMAKAKVRLFNAGSEPVEVVRISSSCPCVRGVGLPLRVPSGQIASLEVVYDPEGEREFQGELAVEVIGHTSDGQVAFQTSAFITVRADGLPVRNERGAP